MYICMSYHTICYGRHDMMVLRYATGCTYIRCNRAVQNTIHSSTNMILVIYMQQV